MLCIDNLWWIALECEIVHSTKNKVVIFYISALYRLANSIQCSTLTIESKKFNLTTLNIYLMLILNLICTPKIRF